MVRVLVVENNEFVLRMVVNALSMASFQVTAVESAGDALAVATKARPHVVVVDYRLDQPELDGIAVFRSVQRVLPHTAGVLMTGYGSPAVAFEAARAGLGRYLDKPFRLAALVTAVDELATAAGVPRVRSSPPAVDPVIVAPDRAERERAAQALMDYLLTQDGGLANRRELAALLLDVVTDRSTSTPVFLVCAREFGEVLRTTTAGGFPTSDLCAALVRTKRANQCLPAPAASLALEELERAAAAGMNLTETELGRRVHVDPAHLGRLLYRATGFHYASLAAAGRLRHVMRDLLCTADPVSAIAATIPYDDARLFHRDLNRVFGHSARHLRAFLASL